MPPDELIRKAETEVMAAAREMARSLDGVERALTPQEQRLRMAVFMLQKAKGLSGTYHVSLPDYGEGEDR